MNIWKFILSAILIFNLSFCSPKPIKKNECVEINISKSWGYESSVPFSNKKIEIKNIPYGQTQEFITDINGNVNACLSRGLYIIDPKGVNKEYQVFFSGQTQNIKLKLLDPSLYVCVRIVGEEDIIVKYTSLDFQDKTYIGNDNVCGLAGIWGFSLDGTSWYVKDVQKSLNIYTEDLK